MRDTDTPTQPGALAQLEGLAVPLGGGLVATLECAHLCRGAVTGSWLVSRRGRELYDYVLSSDDCHLLDDVLAEATAALASR